MSEKSPLLPKWPFYAADGVAVLLALFIVFSGEGPVTPMQIVWVLLCVFSGAAILIAPFFIEFNTRSRLHQVDHDEEAWDRVKRMEEAVAGVKSAGEAFDVAHAQAREEVVDAMSRGFVELAEKMKEDSVSGQIETVLANQQKHEEAIAKCLNALETSAKDKEALQSSLDSMKEKLESIIETVAQSESNAVSSMSTELAELISGFETFKVEWKQANSQLEEIQKTVSLITVTKRMTPVVSKEKLLARSEKTAEKLSKGTKKQTEETKEKSEKEEAPEDAKADEVKADDVAEEGSKDKGKKEEDAPESKDPVEEEPAPKAKESPKVKKSLISKAFSATPDSPTGESAIERIITDQKSPEGDEPESDKKSKKTEKLKKKNSPEKLEEDEGSKKSEEVEASEKTEEVEKAEESKKVERERIQKFEKIKKIEKDKEIEKIEKEYTEELLDIEIEEKPKKKEKQEMVIKQETKIVAHALVGIGNKPYIRGDGPGLNWEKGIEMDFVEIGKWEWRTRFATKPVNCTILLNDEVFCEGKNFKLENGKILSVSPQFVDKK